MNGMRVILDIRQYRLSFDILSLLLIEEMGARNIFNFVNFKKFHSALTVFRHSVFSHHIARYTIPDFRFTWCWPILRNEFLIWVRCDCDFSFRSQIVGERCSFILNSDFDLFGWKQKSAWNGNRNSRTQFSEKMKERSPLKTYLDRN